MECRDVKYILRRRTMKIVITIRPLTYVSQPLLTGVDSQVSSTDGKNVILT